MGFGSDVFGYPLYAMCVAWRGLALGLMGRLEEAMREIDRAIAIGRQGQPIITLVAHYAYALLADLLCDPATAMARARQTVELRLMGSLAECSLGLGWLVNGQWDEATRVLEQGLATCRDRRIHLFLEPIYLNALARAHMGRGDLRQARAAAEEAVAVAGDRGCHGADAYLGLARVLLESEGTKARHEVDSALAGAQRQIDSSGANSRQAYLHEARAELAQVLGDEAAHKRELREAHRLFVEMGATGHAKRLAKELEL
jgi:tetratricopeptide (TPR) repeat protein